MKFQKIKFIIIILFLVLLSCAKQTDNLSKITQKLNLQQYNYLFMVHIAKHDCMSCITNLAELKEMQKYINEIKGHTFICVVGIDDSSFMDIYNAFDTKVPIFNTKDFKNLKFFKADLTPVCYFVNLKTGHLIFMDEFPKTEIKFNALKNLIYAYSGKIL